MAKSNDKSLHSTRAVGQKDKRLFTALADAAQCSMMDLNSQALANTLWAFATVGLKAYQLLTSLSAAV